MEICLRVEIIPPRSRHHNKEMAKNHGNQGKSQKNHR